MSKLITRIGRRGSTRRSIVKLEDRAAGSYGGQVIQDYVTIDTYGNSLEDALRMSFYWAGIRLYTIFDLVDEISEAME